jgi:hypothetical protein
LERHASGPSVEALFAEERARSHHYGGRSVFGFGKIVNNLSHRDAP